MISSEWKCDEKGRYLEVITDQAALCIVPSTCPLISIRVMGEFQVGDFHMKVGNQDEFGLGVMAAQFDPETMCWYIERGYFRAYRDADWIASYSTQAHCHNPTSAPWIEQEKGIAAIKSIIDDLGCLLNALGRNLSLDKLRHTHRFNAACEALATAKAQRVLINELVKHNETEIARLKLILESEDV